MPLHVVAARLGDRPETLLSVYSHLLPTDMGVVGSDWVLGVGSLRCRGAVGAARAEGPVWSTWGSD